MELVSLLSGCSRRYWKTFIILLILQWIRSQHTVALALASSGRAATLLNGKQTSYSALKLPLHMQLWKFYRDAKWSFGTNARWPTRGHWRCWIEWWKIFATIKIFFVEPRSVARWFSLDSPSYSTINSYLRTKRVLDIIIFVVVGEGPAKGD